MKWWASRTRLLHILNETPIATWKNDEGTTVGVAVCNCCIELSQRFKGAKKCSNCLRRERERGRK